MRAAKAEHVEITEEMRETNQREVERLKRSIPADDEYMYEIITTIGKKKRKTARGIIKID